MKFYVCSEQVDTGNCSRALCWKCTQIISGLFGNSIEGVISNCWNNKKKLTDEKLSVLHNIYEKVFITSEK